MPHVIVTKFLTVGNLTNGFLRSFFCAVKEGSQFFRLYRKVKRGMLNAKKKDHYQIWQGRNPDGSYGGGLPEVLPAMVAAEKEGTEEPEGYGGERVFGRIV